MSTFDENSFRAFRLHTIVQNIGTEFYRRYLESKAKENSFASLKTLLEDPVEKPKLLKVFNHSRAYSPYDDKGKLKKDYPEATDIIKLSNLHRNCEVLRKDFGLSHLQHWWDSKNSPVVFDAVLRSKHIIQNQPGAACLVLYHVRNNFLPGTHKSEFSLDPKTYDDALEITIKALEILGESMGLLEEIEDRIFRAKRDPIDENECNNAAMEYQRYLIGKKNEFC